MHSIWKTYSKTADPAPQQAAAELLQLELEGRCRSGRRQRPGVRLQARSPCQIVRCDAGPAAECVVQDLISRPGAMRLTAAARDPPQVVLHDFEACSQIPRLILSDVCRRGLDNAAGGGGAAHGRLRAVTK